MLVLIATVETVVDGDRVGAFVGGEDVVRGVTVWSGVVRVVDAVVVVVVVDLVVVDVRGLYGPINASVDVKVSNPPPNCSTVTSIGLFRMS